MLRLNKDLVCQKLIELAQYLDELEPLSAVSFEEYRADYVQRHAIEKLIELIVETASDINRHILETSGAAPPTTYFSTYDEIGAADILPKALTMRLASTTGLRNRLVHGYEKVEHQIVHRSLKPLIRDYRQYLVKLNDYVQSVKAG
ncbi:MAG: hypothetical protein COY47_02745 [Chloroflexi bacterium CG_4_10_14_0_8_um_filter_57_5]|nr:MAG: hypothetical protein COY47_02745 [Chloroflexi bacterium CG_4_10_14_0_8_um_filter_57_5]